ncbi:hypothetical protein BCR36DRAFT_354009 [Piromyces finnis]|uniref:G-protein coupled receptors family 1 profile domain-containing protein n=1 Tax=Piromyces finnis TaxID=1754191 RepID=A0A1Y1V843_9FUNG|nr:hypothetical protein BCR36DRAFT_354009 [Piromyces finnis]|eukprot:ORX48924.1 hypothetical protein BCR36DRAFT_354009 [Piromyces finnis]
MTNKLYTEDFIDKNGCRWNLNVYNCKDEDYYRAIYYNKLVISVCVSLLDSILIIYRVGIKRRNIITLYGIASIDGLLVFVGLFAYAMIYHAISILKAEEVGNYVLQEFSFYMQYIFVLIAIQIYLTGTLNASPRYKSSAFYYPRPRVANTISFIFMIIWVSIEIVGIFKIGSIRNFPYISYEKSIYQFDEALKNSQYKLWVKITYVTFGVASVITCILFILFGVNLHKTAKRSLEEMYRTKKIKSNVVVPIRIALYKMEWINGACYVFMFVFGVLFIIMGFFENLVYSYERTVFPKIFCVALNIIPPAIIFMTLLSIVYGEARSDIISIFPSTHCEDDDYQMNYTKQSNEGEKI